MTPVKIDAMQTERFVQNAVKKVIIRGKVTPTQNWHYAKIILRAKVTMCRSDVQNWLGGNRLGGNLIWMGIYRVGIDSVGNCARVGTERFPSRTNIKHNSLT